MLRLFVLLVAIGALVAVDDGADDTALAADYPPCAQIGSTTSCLVLDVVVNSPGEQDFTYVGAGATVVADVVIRIDPAHPGEYVSSFHVQVSYDTSWLTAGVPAVAPASMAWGWLCAFNNSPVADRDGNPATGDAYIDCVRSGGPPGGPTGTIALARFTFTADPCCGAGQISSLSIVDAQAVEPVLADDFVSCNPVMQDPGGGCYDATVQFYQHGFPDSDADFWANDIDNCPFSPNPNQENNDRNFIDLPETESFDDTTRANSDTPGDACDPDDDNDGLTDAVETAGAPCASATAATLPLVDDTDGDLALDGAECNTGTDPNSAASKPTLAQCGSTMDSDGDGILNYREVCYYNTDPGNANSDGDACGDGREVASINEDQQVNVIDLQQVAQSSGPSTGPNYIADFDVTKSGGIDVIDLQQVAARSGPCP